MKHEKTMVPDNTYKTSECEIYVLIKEHIKNY